MVIFHLWVKPFLDSHQVEIDRYTQSVSEDATQVSSILGKNILEFVHSRSKSVAEIPHNSGAEIKEIPQSDEPLGVQKLAGLFGSILSNMLPYARGQPSIEERRKILEMQLETLNEEEKVVKNKND